MTQGEETPQTNQMKSHNIEKKDKNKSEATNVIRDEGDIVLKEFANKN